jgi:hypothetical protein
MRETGKTHQHNQITIFDNVDKHDQLEVESTIWENLSEYLPK